MCNYWQWWALSASCWAAQWAGGWAVGWRQGAARNASMMSPSPTLKMRTPALRLHVETLTLKPNAPQGKRDVTPYLKLVG